MQPRDMMITETKSHAAIRVRIAAGGTLGKRQPFICASVQQAFSKVCLDAVIAAQHTIEGKARGEYIHTPREL